MIVEMYSVYDKAVKAFLQPFGARSRGEAIRSFTELANDKSTNVFRHPSDFVLFSVGAFDDNSGMYAPVEPERILGAYECVRDVSPVGRVNGELPNAFEGMSSRD